jgi:hypothetical protein
VLLVVEADDVFRNVRLARVIDDGRSLRRAIEHNGKTLFSRVAVEHGEHFPPNLVYNVSLRGIDLLAHILLPALKLPRQQLALSLQSGFLIVTQRPGAGIETILQVLDLPLQIVKIRLLGDELNLQTGGCLLAFGSGNNHLPNIHYPYFYRRWCSSSALDLGPSACCKQKQQNGNDRVGTLRELMQFHPISLFRTPNHRSRIIAVASWFCNRN